MKKKARSLASTLQFCRLGWRLELWPCLPRAHVAGRSQGPPRWAAGGRLRGQLKTSGSGPKTSAMQCRGPELSEVLCVGPKVSS